MLVAHRGLRIERECGGFYENLLSNFVAAYADGFKCCECDVQETKDGRLIVVHDYKLKDHALPWEEDFVTATGESLAKAEYDRITAAETKDLTLSEIQSIPMRRTETGFEYVPTFNDVLTVIPVDGQMLVELKSAVFSEHAMREIVDLVSAKQDNVIFISFYLENLKSIHLLCREFRKILLTVSQSAGGYDDDVMIADIEGLIKQAVELKALFEGCPFALGLEVSAEPVDTEWFRELSKLGLASQAWHDDKGAPSSLEKTQEFLRDLRGEATYFTSDYSPEALNAWARNGFRK